MDTEYIDGREQAAMIRRAMRQAFPAVTCWVKLRRYAGGASIDVHYEPEVAGTVDPISGRCMPSIPNRRAVEAVVFPYAGGGFDGSIDLAYDDAAYVNEAGEVVGHASWGTAGSGGTVPAHDDAPTGRVRRVRFGARYVFVRPEPPYRVRQQRRAA